MFCTKCGAKQPDDAQFCGQCGALLKKTKEQPNVAVNHPQKMEKQSQKKKKDNKMLITAILVVIVILGVIAAVFFITKSKKEKEFNEQLVEAQRYIEELDYEKAEASYLAAIDIDPKQEEPYIELAEIYLIQNEPEKAVDILEQGKEATNSEVIKSKLSLYTYVDEVLIPELGQPRFGTYELEYIAINEHAGQADVVRDQSGVITSRIKDFDNDGKEELLVAVLRNNVPDKWGEGNDTNSVYLQMYEEKEGEVTLAAEMEACDSILGGEDKESTGVFLKEYDGKIYICGGTYKLVYMFADGSYFTSFAVTYEDEAFVMYAGDQSGIAGSDFYDMREEAFSMADKLEAIGLSRAAADVRETYMLRMTYDDVAIDILFRTQGDNKGRSYNYWNDGKWGKVVIEFWLPELISEEEAEKIAQETEDLTVPDEVILDWRERLEKLEADTESSIDREVNNPNTDMSSMTNSYAYANKCWTNTMNELLDVLQQYMTSEEWTQLCEDQAEWEVSMNRKKDEAMAPYAGGSLASLEGAAVMYKETKARSFELLNILESL